MKTYYIRHTKKLDIDNNTRVRLWKNRKIAIHFPEDKHGEISKKDNDSLDPNDYSGEGKGAMRTLRELAYDGGYVCAEYFLPDKDKYKCLVGRVKPNTEIEYIREGTWGDLKGYSGRPAILKALSLQKVKVIKPSEQTSLLIDRPQQGAIKRWHRAGEKVENLVKKGIKKSNSGLEDLSTAQQETLCSEFMRLPEITFPGLPILSHLLLPIGRNMKDVDIYGISTDGKKIFAQVTYSKFEESKVKKKCKKLSKYSDKGKNHLVFFCDTKEPKKDEDGILIFPIQQVFDRFILTKAGKEWLQYSL